MWRTRKEQSGLSNLGLRDVLTNKSMSSYYVEYGRSADIIVVALRVMIH